MKFLKYCGVFCLVLFILGCKKNKIEPYWDEEKLVIVLADLRIIDGQIKKHIFSEKDSLKIYYKDLLYEIHNINEEDLLYHLEYVQSDPHTAKRIEDKIHDLLSDRLKIIQNY